MENQIEKYNNQIEKYIDNTKQFVDDLNKKTNKVFDDILKIYENDKSLKYEKLNKEDE